MTRELRRMPPLRVHAPPESAPRVGPERARSKTLSRLHNRDWGQRLSGQRTPTGCWARTQTRSLERLGRDRWRTLVADLERLAACIWPAGAWRRRRHVEYNKSRRRGAVAVPKPTVRSALNQKFNKRAVQRKVRRVRNLKLAWLLKFAETGVIRNFGLEHALLTFSPLAISIRFGVQMGGRCTGRRAWRNPNSMKSSCCVAARGASTSPGTRPGRGVGRRSSSANISAAPAQISTACPAKTKSAAPR